MIFFAFEHNKVSNELITKVPYIFSSKFMCLVYKGNQMQQIKLVLEIQWWLLTALMSFALDMGIRHTQTFASLFDMGSTCSLEKEKLNVDTAWNGILCSLKNESDIDKKLLEEPNEHKYQLTYWPTIQPWIPIKS